ncbi:MAG: hypothetical protein AAF497_10345 [Planctomycetota bacterium]
MPPPVQAQVMDAASYWALRKPFEQYLPDSVPEAEVEAELDVVQRRFRAAMSQLGAEGEDWELPGHYQHVRVFYVYLYSRSLYTPKLTKIIQDTMQGFDDRWIGEFECYEVPGCNDRGCTQPVYLNGKLVYKKGHESDQLILTLGLSPEGRAP